MSRASEAGMVFWLLSAAAAAIVAATGYYLLGEVNSMTAVRNTGR